MISGIDRRLLQNVDWTLLAAVGAIVTLSILSLWSLARGTGSEIALRQLWWVGVGLGALVVVASLDYQTLVRAAPLLYVAGLGLLVAVLVLGRTVSGARRWIHVGSLTVQPSELFKLIFVLTLAWALTSRWARPLSRATLLWTAGLAVVPFLLVVRQPDLGTAVVLLPVLAAVLLGVGVRLKVLAGFALGAVAAMPLGWVALREYQRERLLVYLDPFRDPLGTAYNVIQAKIAIGSGQLLGKGVSGATQSRLAFLPERHTDFIFAVFAEMWGFVGCLVLILAYGLLVLRGFEIAAGAREPRGRLVALGVTALFAAQTLINLGMVTGLLPVVGIPLPFMSYGGSSMVVSLMALGLLLSVRMRQFQ
ncbi:MAG: rod shape-determining protein RodA [Candidatus Rokubacteria bacterium]|nr:rod shape-determining protein RodA [Candidatus Rokubacteria bacterium]